MPKYSFCIELPTKNEKENIRYMIESARKHCNYDIIVSDEHSPDGTAKIAKSLGVKVFPRKNPGYGSGLMESLVNAKKLGHTHLLVMDCDRTYPINYIKALTKAADQGYDLVNAGRKMSDIRRLNRVPNIFHTYLVRLLYGGKISDVNSGMKLMRIDKFLGKITTRGNDSTVQTVIIALKNKYKIKEVPIPYNDRHGDRSRGISKIRYRDGFIITWRIIKDRFTR
jgi:glycosyltransferase involved in cell wall biosynthesis